MIQIIQNLSNAVVFICGAGSVIAVVLWTFTAFVDWLYWRRDRRYCEWYRSDLVDLSRYMCSDYEQVAWVLDMIVAEWESGVRINSNLFRDKFEQRFGRSPGGER